MGGRRLSEREGRGERGDEHARMQYASILLRCKDGKEKVAERKWKEKRRENGGVGGGKREDKGRVEPSM